MPVMIRRLLVVLVVTAAGLVPLAVAAGSLHSHARVFGNGAEEGSQRIDTQWAPAPGVTHTARYTAYIPLFYAPYDMLVYLLGDSERIFEVQHSGGSQARHQTQTEEDFFFHTKGNQFYAEWEEMWADESFIYRGTDTSPGHGQYYTLRDPGIYGSKWAPRYWSVGEIYERRPQVTFYDKSSCTPAQGGVQPSYLKFEAFHKEYTFESSITLTNVVELAWVLTPAGQPIERYYYAESYGLVGWWSNNGAHSYISEDHAPGTRPDNLREEIPCLDRSPLAPPQFSDVILQEWPGEHRR